MNPSLLIQNMERQAVIIAQLLDKVTPEQARWKSTPDSWSLLETVRHLLDEEKFDFRLRLDVILHRPNEAWEKIDPAGWGTERDYNNVNLATVLQEFPEERKKSIKWLQNLKNPNWDAVYEAPFGEIRAGDMLAAWAAHDLLHIRQLTEIHWVYLNEQAQPYTTLYAGEWEK